MLIMFDTWGVHSLAIIFSGISGSHKGSMLDILSESREFEPLSS